MNKMKKIILAVISIFMFVLLFSINDVQARGLVYQTWSMDGLDGALVYREFTTPYSATLKNIRSTTPGEKVSGAPQAKYWNSNAGSYIESKWIYNNGSNNSFFDNSSFNYYSFSSVGIRIYGDMELATYNSSGTTNKMGYMTIGAIGNTLPANIYGSANSVKTYVTAKDGIQNILNNRTKAYDMRSGRFSDTNYVKYSNGTLTYRIALVAPNSESEKVTPIYVIDRVLSKDMVSTIKAEAKESDGTSMFYEKLGYTNCLTISSLAKTAANAYNEGEIAINTANDMKNIAFSDRDYSPNSKGLADNRSLGSGLNLYDNILVFPEPPTRTVYYRYVNIGTERQVSASAIENAEKDGKTAPLATYVNNVYTANYNEFDATEGPKTINVDTDPNNPYKGQEKMEYMGYYATETTSKGQAEANISTLVNIRSALNPSTTYTSPSIVPTEDKHIVVEIYYREKTDWETEKHHLLYDENGVYQGESGTTEKEHQSSETDYVEYKIEGTNDITTKYKAETHEDGITYLYQVEAPTTKEMLKIYGYKFIGIKSANVDLTKDNNADGNIDVGDLSTYDKTKTDPYLNRDNKYAFYAYRKKKMYNANVDHVLYDTQAGTSEVLKTETITIIEDEEGPMIETLPYDYLGVLRDYAGESLPPKDSYIIDGSLQATVADANKTIYVGYELNEVEVITRHILYDIEGNIVRVLEEENNGTATFAGGVTVSAKQTYVDKYDYKGYLQTMSATYPTKAIAYVAERECTVNAKDLKVKTVYVNFMYKYKEKNEILEEPDIEIGGNLTVGNKDNPTTTECEQNIFDYDKFPFTTTSGNTIRLGITDLKTRYIAGLSISDDSEPVDKLTTYVIVKPEIISYGTNLKEYPMRVNTKYHVIRFIIPYISTKYEIAASRIYKLSKSQIYDTDSGEDTTGPDLLTKTGANPYEIGYDLSQVKFVINQTENAHYYINFVNSNSPIQIPVEAEISKEDGRESCEDISFHNIDPENPHVYCNGEADNLKLTTIEKANSQVLSEVGQSLDWLINQAEEEGTNITELKLKAHVYSTEGYEQGIIKTKRDLGNGEYKDIYYVFDNDTTDVEAEIKNWFMRFLQQIVNGIKEAIAILFDTEYEETVFWDLEDEAMTSMNVSARNFLQQKDTFLFTLNLLAQTGGYELKLNENNTVIAKTDSDTGIKYFSIDSTNFKLNSWNDEAICIVEELEFKGNVDLTNIGGMTITEEGKKMYEEGFSLPSDLDMTRLTTNNSVEADINKDAINGMRILYGLATYNSESGLESNTIGDFEDNIYHSDKNTIETMHYFWSRNTNKYNSYSERKQNSDVINVYTPIRLGEITELIGDHVNKEPISQLEEGAPLGISDLVTIESGFHFYLGLEKYNKNDSDADHKYNSTVDTLPYLKGYYVKFSFDVKDLNITIGDEDTHNDPNGNNKKVYKTVISGSEYTGGIVKANTWIYVELPDDVTEREKHRRIKVSAKGIDTADDTELSYTVRAVANNINRELTTRSFAESRLSFYDTFGNICNDKINLENIVITDDTPVYYDEVTKKVEIKQVDRLFDFRVTDVNDVDWKNVFRNKDTSHNGVAYYVGDKKWVSGKTDPVSRTTKEIGIDPITTLPIGPHKNTDLTYTKSPKLGYRISFDVKVSGEEKIRNVIVKPSFYFIDDEGNISNNISLYYKNDNNAYVSVNNYPLSFTPKDGYRLLESGTEYLSTKEVKLGTVEKLTLQKDTMSITTENYQIFYGEFKLPNTTVAVKEGGSITSKSDILKDGYIAVKFDITTTYESGKELQYNRPMDKRSTVDTPLKKLLVTQWSFEGFLGSRYGKDSLKNTIIQLENKNKVSLTDANSYSQVIGTVVLFDSDERAASDFN